MFRYLVYWLDLSRSLVVNRNLFHLALCFISDRKMDKIQPNASEWVTRIEKQENHYTTNWYEIVIHSKSIQFILNNSIRRGMFAFIQWIFVSNFKEIKCPNFHSKSHFNDNIIIEWSFKATEKNGICVSFKYLWISNDKNQLQNIDSNSYSYNKFL